MSLSILRARLQLCVHGREEERVREWMWEGVCGEKEREREAEGG